MSAMEQIILAIEHMRPGIFIMENVSEDLPLNSADSFEKFKELTISGMLDDELKKAYEYVNSLPAMVPAGVTELGLSAADVKKLVDDNPEGFLFSGTLSDLVVDDRALSTIDYAGIGYVIESADTAMQLKSLLRVITVNVGEGEQRSFRRTNKDAEVDALCLLMFWHSSNSQVHSQLIALASDLVFFGSPLRPLPLLSYYEPSPNGRRRFWTEPIVVERKHLSSEAMGVSAWRNCIFLSEYLEERH